MKIYFCLEAIEFQCNFVLRRSKVQKLVRTNQFQVKSTKMGTGQKFVTLQYQEYVSNCSYVLFFHGCTQHPSLAQSLNQHPEFSHVEADK